MAGGASGENPGAAACSLAAALAAGACVEPVLHPKPGAVTRLASHPDKGVVDFEVAAAPLAAALVEACTRRGGEGLAAAFRLYARTARLVGLRGNVSLGTLLLTAPLAAALGDGPAPPEALAGRASTLALEAGPDAAQAYYEALEAFRPSHLGRYRGPVPGVGSGEAPCCFRAVLEAASWDLVHSEVAGGYPETLRVARRLLDRAGGPRSLEEEALKAMLELLARRGDTLILAKWGLRAYLRARAEAWEALRLSARIGVVEAVEWLDRAWRPRGWSPGAVLDVVAAGIGLYLATRISEAGL